MDGKAYSAKQAAGMADEQLKVAYALIRERIARVVSSVHGVVSRGEADRLEALEAELERRGLEVKS